MENKERNMNKKNKKQLITIITLLFFIISFTIFYNRKNYFQNKVVWIELNPIKCLGNAWEFDWLQNNPGEYDNYPKNQTESIIKNFYAKKGIKIIEIKTKNDTVKTCDACNCPQGKTLKVLINKKYQEDMIKSGWKITLNQQNNGKS